MPRTTEGTCAEGNGLEMGSLPLEAGDFIVVREGITDPDFPDMRLDGWTGIVIDVDRRARCPAYLVRWSESCLDRLPPEYRARCESRDLAFDRTWLLEEDVKPAAV